MNYFYMHLLHAVGIAIMRHINKHIRKRSKLSATLTSKTYYFYSLLLWFLCCLNYILRITAGSNSQQYVTFITHTLYKSTEYMSVSIVVGSACYITRVRYG